MSGNGNRYRSVNEEVDLSIRDACLISGPLRGAHTEASEEEALLIRKIKRSMGRLKALVTVRKEGTQNFDRWKQVSSFGLNKCQEVSLTVLQVL